MNNEFEKRVSGTIGAPLKAAGVQIMQVNVGYRCNISCKHCHLEAGPGRIETMEKETFDAILRIVREHEIRSVDITGGAPEFNPHFTWFVTEAKRIGCHVIVRTNLTIYSEEGFEDLPAFYSEHEIEISASLPYYLDSGVDRVRGEGTFRKSISAIQKLNSLGYGDGRGARKLNLVYNPAGAFLAPAQECLEAEYRRELKARHNITFDRLLAFSNMPIGRFRRHLEKAGLLGKYMKKLADAFNPATIESLMCRRLISVGWDGALYDCDFNQALGIHLQDSYPWNIMEFDMERLSQRLILTGDHCYGCTAGQGST